MQPRLLLVGPAEAEERDIQQPLGLRLSTVALAHMVLLREPTSHNSKPCDPAPVSVRSLLHRVRADYLYESVTDLP